MPHYARFPPVNHLSVGNLATGSSALIYNLTFVREGNRPVWGALAYHHEMRPERCPSSQTPTDAGSSSSM